MHGEDDDQAADDGHGHVGDGPTAPSAWVHLPPAEVVVAVDVAPVPEIPIASLRDFLVAEHGDDGRIVDWTLDTAAVHTGRSLHAYWAWRRTWERRWSLGHVDNLVDLGRIAMSVQHGAPGVLHVLLELLEAHHRGAEESVAPVELDLASAETLAGELVDARDAIDVVGGTGRAVVDDTPRDVPRAGFARTWAPAPAPRLLVANQATQVSVGTAGELLLVTSGADVAQLTDVVEVDLTGDRVAVVDAVGRRVELVDDAASPLAWIVPGAVRWRVRSIPLVVVWSACFAAVPAALDEARRVGAPLRVTRVVPLV